MKKILSIIFLLILIGGLLPWVLGYYFKLNYLQLIAKVNNSKRAKIILSEYHLGWLRSHAVVCIEFSNLTSNISFNTQEFNLADLSVITLEQNISHGPIIYDKATGTLKVAIAEIHENIHLSDKLESILFGQSIIKGIGAIHTTATFGGFWLNHLQIPAMTFSFPSLLSHAAWQGVNANIDFKISRDAITAVKSNITLGALSAKLDLDSSGPPFDINIQSITQTIDSTLHRMGLWRGKYKISAPGITIKNGSKLLFAFNDFTSTGNATISPEKMYSISGSYRVQNIEIPDSFLPDISAAILNISLNNLNGKECVDILNLIGINIKNRLPVGEHEKQLVTMLPGMITPSTNFAIDLSFNTTKRPLRAKINAHWLPKVSLPKTIDELTQKINAKADIRVAISLFDFIITNLAQHELQQVSSQKSFTQPKTMSSLMTEKQSVFRQQIDEMQQKGQLAPTDAIEITALYDKQLPLNEFSLNLVKMGIAPNLQSEINMMYRKAWQSSQNTLSSIEFQPNEVQLQQKSEIMMKKNFNDFVQQGYIKQDENDYVTSIISRNGAVKINGKSYPPSQN